MEIRAELVKLIYENRDRTFSVAKFKNSSEFIAAGSIPVPTQGRVYKLTGEWAVHPKFGRQFSVKSAFPEDINSKKGILAFLGGGRIKGVGKKTAEKVVEAFGEKTAFVLDNHPEKLREIKGLRKKAAEEIDREWKKDAEARNVLIYLSKFGVGQKTAEKIARELGPGNVAGVVENNPYVLSEIVGGIGFKKADGIALGMGIAKNSPFRLRSALNHVLSESIAFGHTCIPLEELIDATSKITGADAIEIRPVLGDMLGAAALKSADFSGVKYVYTFSTERAEKTACKEIIRLFGESGACPEKFNISSEFLPVLKEAVSNASAFAVSVITGGPGTGKTTLIRKIAESFKGNIELCAPTGRAAKRLEEVTKIKARTIHRLLNYNPVTGMFKYNSNSRIDDTFIIVDESSMIDIYLAASLLQAAGRNTRFIFVGDADQLPPVGPGNFFRDIVNCSFIPAVRLEEVFRQKSTGGIIPAAKDILVGKMPSFNGKDFVFVKKGSLIEIAEEVCRIAGTELVKRYGKRTSHCVQVITPVNGGEAGTKELNSRLAELLNPGKTERPASGDKVMQISNDYDLDIFNGDTGVVVAKNNFSLTVDFSYKTVEIEKEKRDNLVLGYAVTVHKSQGTEYPAVVVAVHSSHYMMLARDLLYTAVTRGKELVIIVGDKKALYTALANDKSSNRNFFLKNRLEAEFEKGR
ncbi:ATP-dependent RecD-like DNA helicase [candidate division WOR-3 bacterium]|nr:ATP-dependent RecD-like DNA helicase [candidate division WOR-3 bacterium]